MQGTAIGDNRAGPVPPVHATLGAVPLGPSQAGLYPAVVQRAVLHKINDRGETRFYSDLEKGAADYATVEEAQAVDDRLSANPDVIKDRLTTGQNRERRVPTAYAYANPKLTVSSRARQQSQGPHSLSFIAFEQRLQNRLRKGQSAELADQVLSPADAGVAFTREYKLPDTHDRHKRFMLDYNSLHAEFQRRLTSGESHAIDSPFHLVARQLLQLHPYTAYRGPTSSPLGEDRHGILGTHTIDKGAKTHFVSQEAYEKYLQQRGDMFHSSDEEEEGYAPAVRMTGPAVPYEFTEIPTRRRRYARARVVPVIGAPGDADGGVTAKPAEEAEVGEKRLRDDEAFDDDLVADGLAERTEKKRKTDTAGYDADSDEADEISDAEDVEDEKR